MLTNNDYTGTGDNVDLIFRADPIDGFYYLFGIFPGRNQVELWGNIKGGTNSGYYFIDSASLSKTIEFNTIYTIRAEGDGIYYNFYVAWQCHLIMCSG